MTPKTDDTCVAASRDCSWSASSSRSTAGLTVPAMEVGTERPMGSRGAPESDNAY